MLYRLWLSSALLVVPLLVSAQYHSLILTAPSAGNEVSITYSPSGTPLDSSRTIYAIAKMHVKNGKRFMMAAQDIDLYGNGNQWNGSFTIPDSCVSFFVVIKNGLGTIDANNGEGYTYTLKDTLGQGLPGGDASLAYKFLETYSPYGFSYSRRRALKLLENDLQTYPELKPLFFSTYIETVDFTNASARRKLTKEADIFYRDYEKHGAEMLGVLGSLYKKLGQSQKAEKCTDLLLEKFPESRIAFQWRTRPYQESFFEAETLEERLKIHREMIQVMEEHVSPDRDLLHATLNNELNALSHRKEFSLTELDNQRYSATIQNLQLSKLLRENYWEDGDLSAWLELLDSSKYYFSKQYLYNAFARRCSEQDTLLEKAYEMATRAVSMTRQHLNAPRTLREQSFTYFSDSEIKLSRKITLAENLTTQASVLHKQNKIKEALDAYREAIEFSDRLNSEINEQFATFLIEAKMFGEAREEIQQAMRIGKHTLAMEQMLNDLPDDQKLSDTKGGNNSDELTKNYLASKRVTIAATLQNTPAPDFELMSLEGDTVQLSDLKGKIVILDFWASWCPPCILSFPGMQKAVEKYDDNPDVAFLFINLDEGEVRGKIRKHVYEEGYDFKVLLTSNSEIAQSYSVHGIPVKFVIDKEGIIRFRKGSFESNIKDEVEELSIMIDLAVIQSSDY